MNENKDATTFWDKFWGDGEDRVFWKEVAPEIVDLIESNSPERRPDVLDLGCGLGRNAIAFARAGFHVTGTDFSSNAVEHTEKWAEELGLKVRTKVCEFTENVFEDESFDIVVSVNVIYHGNREQLSEAVSNIKRWLRPGGIFYFTCPTPDDIKDTDKQIAPYTVELGPGHVHCYASSDDLEQILDGLKMRPLKRKDHHWEKDGQPQFSSRWRIWAEKP